MLMHPLTGDLRYYHAAGFRDWEAVAACVVAGLLGGLSGGHLKTRSRNLIIQFVGNCLLIVPFCGLVLVVFYRVGSWDRRMPLMYLTVCFVLSGIWTIFGAVLAAVEERIVTHPGSPT
ncbi:MAG: hypothetical protein M3Z54_03090 [Gemmatimonadota bacterium]|nr:hypothetical protein [Gemmatimonadota bacterium]